MSNLLLRFAGTLSLATFIASPSGPDLLETAKTAKFTTLVAMLQSAGLADTLKGPGPFTIFAPTDAAFAKLPPGALDNLLKPQNQAKLQGLLRYHLVSGRLMGRSIVTMRTTKTLHGQSLSIQPLQDGQTMIDAAHVMKSDMRASNGVIHAIDLVLMPK